VVCDGERNELVEVGYVVLRRFFDPHPLSVELDRALEDGTDGRQRPQRFDAGTGTVSFRYVPMMCERTPVSLDLAGRLASVAESLLQRPVLPGRAKGTRYFSDTSWHRDSEYGIQSLGCLAYLDRLTATTGALRVLPRSHVNPTLEPPTEGENAGVAVDTDPGDVVVFDERLMHGSHGGGDRRQWRVDFVVDPAPVEVQAVQTWFAQGVPDERYGVGYEARLFPSFGTYWRSLHPRWAARLIELGVLAPRSPGNGRASDLSP
jgi:hypothetical protein